MTGEVKGLAFSDQDTMDVNHLIRVGIIKIPEGLIRVYDQLNFLSPT